MNERKSVILAIAISLAFMVACGGGTPTGEDESVEPISNGGEEGAKPPAPIVDLDPDPKDPQTYFAWYRTEPQQTNSGVGSEKSKMDHSGSVLAGRIENECPFRKDLIEGQAIETFVVIDANGSVIADASKVRMQTYGESIPDDRRLRFEITIERDVAGNRLNWTVDDLSKPEEPPCGLTPTEDFDVNVLPTEFKNALKQSLFEISGTERQASDFSFSIKP